MVCSVCGIKFAVACAFSGCTSCTFHTITPLRPLVFSGNENLLFAPYHTYYACLGEHMRRAGIGTLLNQWDQPLAVGTLMLYWFCTST